MSSIGGGLLAGAIRHLPDGPSMWGNSESTESGSMQANPSPARQRTGSARPILGPVRPESGSPRPHVMARFDQTWALFDQSLALFGQTSVRLQSWGPLLTNIGSGSTLFGARFDQSWSLCSEGAVGRSPSGAALEGYRAVGLGRTLGRAKSPTATWSLSLAAIQVCSIRTSVHILRHPVTHWLGPR